ncbi:unnamed protein product, partial [Iphiclides podalirius]
MICSKTPPQGRGRRPRPGADGAEVFELRIMIELHCSNAYVIVARLHCVRLQGVERRDALRAFGNAACGCQEQRRGTAARRLTLASHDSAAEAFRSAVPEACATMASLVTYGGQKCLCFTFLISEVRWPNLMH